MLSRVWKEENTADKAHEVRKIPPPQKKEEKRRASMLTKGEGDGNDEDEEEQDSPAENEEVRCSDHMQFSI